jgi:hypothetical protein
MAIREGRWDCPSCGSKAVYGRHVDCPGCGKPRPAGIRFYLTDDAPAITDPARLAEAAAGADWVCGHCGASTRATETECGGCGAARGTSPSQPVVDYATADVPRSGDASAGAAVDSASATAPGAQPSWTCAHCQAGNAGDSLLCTRCRHVRGSTPRTAPVLPLAAVGAPAAAPVPVEETTPYKRWGWSAAAVAVAALFAAGIIRESNVGNDYDPAASWSPLVPAVVAGMRWERDITVEERSVVEGTGFQLPDSAQVLGSERAVVRYDSVRDGYRTEYRDVEEMQDVTEHETRTRRVSERVEVGERTYVCGQRDMGNGYFEDRECTEPVYETRTSTETYEVPVTRQERITRTVQERIPVYRSFPVYGTRYRWSAPQWNAVRADTARGDTAAPAWPIPRLGSNQRQGPRSERYFVILRQAGSVDVEVPVRPEQWEAYRVGQRLAMRTHRWGGRTNILPPDSLPACLD